MSITIPLWAPAKDPEEVKDYVVNWSKLLKTDTIATSVWSITDGDGALIINSTSHTDALSTVWVRAGTDGIVYTLLNHIVTGGGRTYEQSGRMKCRSK